MFPVDGHRSSGADPVYDVWYRWLRLAGYMLPPQVYTAAEALFAASYLNSKRPRSLTAHEFLATSLLRQALVFYPLDHRLLGYVQRLHSLVPASSGFDVWLRGLRRLHRSRPDYFMHSVEISAPMRWKKPQVVTEDYLKDENPGAMATACYEFWSLGHWETVRQIFLRMMAMPVAPYLAPIAAWSAWNAGDRDLAARWLHASMPPSFLTFNLLAEMAMEAGDKEQARRYWKQSLRWEPYQPHLFHRYWESQDSRSATTASSVGKVHIVLYTYNKLETTLATLQKLLVSGIEACPVTLLNNGSTSFSKQDLEQGVRTVAQGRVVDIIHLPVNIGAPAARNWLWHLPQVKNCDYVAFLDDDVLVPPNWLSHYLESLDLFPSAVVVGPRGLNPGTLPTIQYVHRFFHQIDDHKILFTPAAPMFEDFGQFSYRHPCLSVMGCCHLFHRRRWESLGIPDFDISFAPSQVDDLEHDLQIWKKGGQVLFDGRVAVIHLQDAGRAAPRSRAAWGHVWGNHMKMESKFTGAELMDMKRRVEEADDSFHERIRNEIEAEVFGETKAVQILGKTLR
ncbi:glycosyltransferase [Desulfosoma caldarium]|uniref:GT2 family glycosyltransferase n=1 Tax=Desulfosoma caldarium TaxID=610254 RepID=A0A3N1UMY8_9BACT|nr:glycosyltransferase [Desulfosoma caldarium]ROQ90769.1 GT2 family glycosyltransferase [Desulfosoma caldarium]